MKTEPMSIADIEIVEGRRALREEAIGPLMESMKQLGLQAPICVRIVEEMELPGEGLVLGVPVLVAGRHRLEAAKRLGWTEIEAFVLEGDEREARLWEIAENLHRAELTVQERADQVAEWVRLTAEKVVQVAPPSGGPQPAEQGIRKAAKELGITRREAQRALKIASLPDAARAAAAEAGLANNQTALLEAAKSAEPVAELRRIRARKGASEAARRKRDADLSIRMNAAAEFADWLRSRSNPEEVPTIISWLLATMPVEVVVLLQEQAP